MRVNGAYRPSSGCKACRMSTDRAQFNEERRRHITTTIPETLGTLGYPVPKSTRYIG
jgi:hypothetical protein